MSPSGSTCLFWLAYALFFDVPQSVEFLWTSDQPVAETSTWQHVTLTTDKQTTSKHPVGFEPKISAGELPKTYALDRAATGIGNDGECRSQWPRGLRRRSTAARPLRLWVRNPPGAWMFACCECCVLVSATDWSLVQRSPTDCGASLFVIKKPRKWEG